MVCGQLIRGGPLLATLLHGFPLVGQIGQPTGGRSVSGYCTPQRRRSTQALAVPRLDADSTGAPRRYPLACESSDAASPTSSTSATRGHLRNDQRHRCSTEALGKSLVRSLRRAVCRYRRRPACRASTRRPTAVSGVCGGEQIGQRVTVAGRRQVPALFHTGQTRARGRPLNLDIADGEEFLALVEPPDCGRSTSLRKNAGSKRSTAARSAAATATPPTSRPKIVTSRWSSKDYVFIRPGRKPSRSAGHNEWFGPTPSLTTG